MRKLRLDHIGPIIREHRTAAGLSQEELADRIGVTRQTVSRLERDSTDTTIGTLTRALRELDIQTYIAEAEPSGPTSVRGLSTAQSAAHLIALRNLSAVLNRLPNTYISALPSEDQVAIQHILNQARESKLALEGPLAESLVKTLGEMRTSVLAQRTRAL
jgi:transcriptional regulator with XRE-family HTH domain